MQNEERREPFYERRARRRAPLHWSVRLFRGPSTQSLDHSIDTVTRNVSSSGFYCVVPETFPTEQPVECQITIAPSGGYAHDDEILLQGTARIVRLEDLNNEGVGMACHLEEYSIVKVPQPSQRPELMMNGKYAL